VLVHTRRRERQDAAGDALDVSRALARRAIGEKRLFASHGQPHRVVVLDVAELVERHTVMAGGESAHPSAELGVRANTRLVDDELNTQALSFRPCDFRERAVGREQPSHEIDRRRQPSHFDEGSLDKRCAQPVSE
jgi:hypothetical protein